MKVLHVIDTSLPDARVEKMAYLSKKRGWDTFFAGPAYNSFALGENVFTSLHIIPWNRYARLGIQPYFYSIKRKLRRIVSREKPDIIHAHNIFSAKMICDLGFPFVFDDHELVSLEKKSDVEWGRSGIADGVSGRYEVWRWSTWEREVSLRAPIVTVSDSIAEFYRSYGDKVFVMPNYPSLFELSKTRVSKEKDETFTAVYLGNDISTSFRPYRNIKGLAKVFKGSSIRLVVIGDVKLSSKGMIISKGYIPHLRLYDVMSKYHVGLLPWKKHWFHKYANPNKPYIYCHAGMIVLVTSSLQNVVEALDGRAKIIEDYTDLKETLVRLSQDIDMVLKEGKDNKEYAQNHLVFEHYEKNVMEAYKNAT